MAGVNPGGISWSNIGITWGHGRTALLAKHTKLIILCLHAKKLLYHVINSAKMIILWLNIRVRSPPSWNPVLGTTWLRFSSRPQFRSRARNPVGPQPVECTAIGHLWNSGNLCLKSGPPPPPPAANPFALLIPVGDRLAKMSPWVKGFSLLTEFSHRGWNFLYHFYYKK